MFSINIRLIFILALLLVTSCASVHSSVDYRQSINEEVAFLVRLERCVNRVLNSKNKSPEKMISLLLDVKEEIEFSQGFFFSIDKCVAEAIQHTELQGCIVPIDSVKTLKKNMKKQMKHREKHYDSLKSIITIDEYLEFLNKNGSVSEIKTNCIEERTSEVDPLFAYGVAVTVCGVFIQEIPLQICKEWSKEIIEQGTSAAYTSIIMAN